MAGGKRSRVQMVINPSPRRQMEKCDGSRRPLSGAAVASLSLSLSPPSESAAGLLHFLSTLVR